MTVITPLVFEERVDKAVAATTALELLLNGLTERPLVDGKLVLAEHDVAALRLVSEMADDATHAVYDAYVQAGSFSKRVSS